MSEPKSSPLISESQYIGRSSIWFNRRTVLALFCFGAYFLSSPSKDTADLLLLVGIGISIISVGLLFIKHFTVKVYPTCIIINGLWSTSIVKIDLSSIVSAEKSPYSKYLLNNPVYNLHKKGTIRFYSGGKEAVKLVDKDGLVYMIGSKKADELVSHIQKLLPKN